MIIEKNLNLPASTQDVWRKIENMEAVIRCMPGVEEVNASGDNKWHIVIKQKVGFISATFDAEMKVISWQPPSHLEAAVDATGRKGLGKALMTMNIDLIAASEKETLAKYRSDVTLSGNIATFGQKVLGGKTEQMANGFAEAFTKSLTG